jgi:hypothetical protein
MLLDAPKQVPWPIRMGPGGFIDVYDWDQIVLDANATYELSSRLVLCSGIVPCSLSIHGTGGGVLLRTGSGGIACLAKMGCASLTIVDTVLECESGLGVFTALEVEGAYLSIQGSSFIGCSSLSDGGSVRGYHGSVIDIGTSLFQDSHSEGSGGAISVIGGALTISESVFLNCSSTVGGGAILADDFFCYGSMESVTTRVGIESCTFEACSSDGYGGAILVKSKASTFTVAHSEFLQCKSKRSGGAISSFDGGDISIMKSSFVNNSAGLGGGALYSHFSPISLRGLYCSGNTALAGGGGVLLWQGVVPPSILPWCDAGSYPSAAFECSPSSCAAACISCQPGWFGLADSSACSMCEAGKYSATEGASHCHECEVGTYSEFVGASSLSSCVLCGEGTFSTTLASSACELCPRGSFSSSIGTTYCESCDAGKYIPYFGANRSDACIACDAGKYSGTGSAYCSPCNPGQYSLAESQDCIDCLAGSFANSILGSPACYPCLSGSYSGDAADDCTLCQAGKYSNTLMATSEEVCISCNVGEFSEDGYAQCYRIEASQFTVLSDIPEDDSSETIQLPFLFPFYCSNYSSTLVYQHGVIAFGLGVSVLEYPRWDEQIPNFRGTYIAAFWRQLRQRPRSLLLERQSDIEIAFQWRDWGIPEFDDGSVSFQISLFRNGSIIISYIWLRGPDSLAYTATAGIESNGEGVKIAHYNPKLYSRLCIHLFPDLNQCNHYYKEEYRCPEAISMAPSCPPGAYMDNDLTCVLCEPGKYQTGHGMISGQNCVACKAGKYATASGGSTDDTCLSCNSSVSEGATSCSPDTNMSANSAQFHSENVSADLTPSSFEADEQSLARTVLPGLFVPATELPNYSTRDQSTVMDVYPSYGKDARLPLNMLSILSTV